MPIYEYKCDNCSKVFDKIRSSSKRDEPVDCPKCGAGKGHRKVSLFSSKAASSGAGAFSAAAAAPRFT